MNGIIGFTELLKKENLTHEKILKYIDVIQKSSNRMLRIINDLIDISKIEAGQVDLHYQDISVRELFSDIKTFFQLKARSNNIELKSDIKTLTKSPVVYADKDKLIQILMNLVNNAIKFTTDGFITIGFTHKEDGFYEFYVKDTGLGIPNEIKHSIFDRFVKFENPNKKLYEGTGIGLPITKALVELHGGKIWFETKENFGTTFYFTIPV